MKGPLRITFLALAAATLAGCSGSNIDEL